MDQRPKCVDSYSGSLTASKKRDYFPSEHFDVCSSTVLMQFPSVGLHHGSCHQQSDRRPSVEEGDGNDFIRPHEFIPPCNTFMGKFPISHFSKHLAICLQTLLTLCIFFDTGTFGKTPWRSQHESYTGISPPSVAHNVKVPHENPYVAPDIDSDQEERNLTPDPTSEQKSSICEQLFDGDSRTDALPQHRTST